MSSGSPQVEGHFVNGINIFWALVGAAVATIGVSTMPIEGSTLAKCGLWIVLFIVFHFFLILISMLSDRWSRSYPMLSDSDGCGSCARESEFVNEGGEWIEHCPRCGRKYQIKRRVLYLKEGDSEWIPIKERRWARWYPL